MRRLPAVLAAAALVATSACGSTVAMSRTTQVPGQVDGELAAPTQPGTAEGPAAVGPGVVPGNRPGPPGTGSAPPQGITPSEPGAVAPGQRQTGPITVGFVVQANTAELAASVGADNLQNGNERAMVEALVADVNARGGIGGRQLKAVYYHFDGSTQSDFAALQQEACSTFTEDNKVFAVLLGWHAFADHALETCLQRKGVISINSAGILTGGEGTLSQLLDTVAPPGLALGRQARSYVRSVGRQGFLGSGVKVGLIALDTPEYQTAVNRELLPELRRQGVTGADVVYYPALRTSGDVSRQSAAMSSAVLRFRSNGVDRVLFLQQGINGPFMFMQAADSQGYRPRYALSSTDAPTALAPLVSPTQLRGTVGMGWVPVIDVPASNDRTSAPGRKACLDLIRKKTGETFANRTVEYVGLSFCDSLGFFVHAAGRTQILDRTAFRAAVAGLGTSYSSPLVLRSRFSASQRDGAAEARDLRFVESCSCFAYKGAPHPLT